MRFSILHISDLHRDLKDELANGPLLQSLLWDIERCRQQEPGIPPPALCIVSGDLIFGVSPKHPAPAAELDRQYAQALEFLIALADACFEGDRERIVLIPGNHDVSYPAVIASATALQIPTSAEEKKVLTDELWAPNTLLRWSWAELCFYRIDDTSLYEQRLAGFAHAYSEFYRGKRTFSLTPEDQFQLFDYPSFGLSIAALNSCHRNDPLRRAGRFHPSALSSACAELRRPERAGWLLAATWHHSVGGNASQNDFLDHGAIQYLIDSGVSIGFHGHQHADDCVDERYRLGPDQRKMTLISASTLCAEQANLKPGIPRGYNLIQVDTENWIGRVNSRRMVNSDFLLPVWGPGQFIATGMSYVDFALSKPFSVRPLNLDTALVLEQADSLLVKGQWEAALATLAQIPDNPLARTFAIHALQELGVDSETVRILWPPSTNEEIVMVGAALLSLGNENLANNLR